MDLSVGLQRKLSAEELMLLTFCQLCILQHPCIGANYFSALRRGFSGDVVWEILEKDVSHTGVNGRLCVA